MSLLPQYEENKAVLECVRAGFRVKSEIIQREKADLACAELLQTEMVQKTRVRVRVRTDTFLYSSLHF